MRTKNLKGTISDKRYQNVKMEKKKLKKKQKIPIIKKSLK